MNAFDLHVEDARRIHAHAAFELNDLRQAFFVRPLDAVPVRLKFRVFREFF